LVTAILTFVIRESGPQPTPYVRFLLLVLNVDIVVVFDKPKFTMTKAPDVVKSGYCLAKVRKEGVNLLQGGVTGFHKACIQSIFSNFFKATILFK
jgi:hypothetical protein